MVNRKKKTASIVDVAKATGVSTATVSRVFNKPDTVRPETLEHVRRIATKLGFKLSERRPGPKPQIKELRPVIRLLHFLDPNMGMQDSNETFLLLKRGAEASANAAGYRLAYNVYASGDEVVFEAEEGRTAGLLLMGEHPSEKTVEKLRAYPSCWVMAGPWSPDWGDHVMPDHQEVGRLAARYLLDRKHRNVAFVAPFLDDRINRFRLEGFQYEIKTDPQVNWTVVSSGDTYNGAVDMDYSLSALDHLAKNLAASEFKPDAIFIDNDATLFLIYPALIRLGIMPGRDFEVVSCNCIDMCRRQLPFEFRSIDVHFELIGRLGVGQLLWRINNPGILPRVRSLVLPELL